MALLDNFEDFSGLLQENELKETPVEIDTFLYDRYFMGLKKVSDLQKLIISVMSQIYLLPTLEKLHGLEEAQRIWDTETVNELVLCLGKACQAPETPIFNARSGKWERLDSFSKPFNRVIGYTDGELKHEWATDSFQEGYGPMLRVKTALGFEEKVYVKHKYYIWNKSRYYHRNRKDGRQLGPEWTYAENLIPGDKIAIGMGFDVVEPENLPLEDVRFIGYMLGDGMCPTDKNPIINVDFGGDEKESLARYLNAIEAIGSSYSLKKHPTKNMNFVRHGRNSKCVELAAKYDLWGKRANNKVIPDAIWKCSNDVLVEFIGALWSTDGCVYLKKQGDSNWIAPIAEYCTISKQLAEDIQRILLRLGIPASIRSRIPKYNYKSEKLEGQRAYYLTVSSSESFTKFANLIPLLDHKKKQLEKGLELISQATIPYQRDNLGLYWDTIKSVESAGESEYWTMTQPESHNYVGNGILSAQSGKDFTSRLAFCYAIHKLHCLKDPLDYYGKAYGTYIDMLNIAVNAEQAQNVFFEPLKNILGHSPYFQDKGFQVRTKRVDFDECPIRLFSGNSEAEAWEGLDLILVVLDEIAAFKTLEQMRQATGDRLSADAIYKMSKISVISRFPEVGKVACLSFPRHIDDFIMQRYDESEKEEKVFRLKAKTWEMNPTITREMLEPEYRRNPIDARARFEADPPRAANPFFKDPDRVLQCFQGQYQIIDEGTAKEKRKLIEIPDLNPIDIYGRLKPWFKCADDYTRYIHVDLALNRDKVGLAMVHIPGVRTIQTSINTWDKLPVIKMDLVHWWQGSPNEEVDFGDIREFISILCRKFPVGLVTFDRWNSADTIATLQKRNIRAELHSVRTSDYDTLATAFYDGRFYGYFTDELVEQELLKLQLLPNGKVDHQKTCLEGKVRIPLLDGTCPAISELVDKEVWVYSALETGDIVPGKAVGKCTGEADTFVDVVLDNGSVTRCTPEHLWMLKDGSYKQAKDLIPAVDRLMPISRIWPRNGGYEGVTDGNGKTEVTHRLVYQFITGEDITDKLVHHKNEIKTDNQPKNLLLESKSEHSRRHTTQRHIDDLDYRKKLSEGVIEFNKLPSTREKRSKQFKKIMTPEESRRRAEKKIFFRHDITPEKLLEAAKYGCKTANAASKYLNCGRNVIIRVLKDMKLENWEALMLVSDNNHNVRYIIPVKLEASVPIYDLVVEDHHNFAVSGGVFIHNSGKDISDALAGATYNACEQMEVMNEIEIQIIGDEDIDWREHEAELAKMEDKERELGDRVRRNSVMYDTHDINDFEIQMI